MKNAAKILSHLQHQPQFNKLTQFACIKKVQQLFPPHLQKMVLYGYMRNDILFFALAHPGAKQEFDIILDSIKTPLKLYPPKECGGTTITDIKAFVSHKPRLKFTETKPTEYLYRERAAGDFINNTDAPKLHKIIEKIRTIIHDRTD